MSRIIECYLNNRKYYVHKTEELVKVLPEEDNERFVIVSQNCKVFEAYNKMKTNIGSDFEYKKML